MELSWTEAEAEAEAEGRVGVPKCPRNARVLADRVAGCGKSLRTGRRA